MIIVDTGKKGGALSIAGQDIIKSFFEFEIQNDIFLNLPEFYEWILEQNDNEVLIERIPKVFGHGNVSTIAEQQFHVGCVYATVYIALEAIGLELIEVWPRSWQAGALRVYEQLPEDLHIDSDKVKLKVEAVAKHYFPKLTKNYTKRVRVNDALTDCLGMFINHHIDGYLTD